MTLASSSERLFADIISHSRNIGGSDRLDVPVSLVREWLDRQAEISRLACIDEKEESLMKYSTTPSDAIDNANTHHAWKMHDELLERENRRKATCADCGRAYDPVDDGFQNPQGICWCAACGEFMLLSTSASMDDCDDFEWR